MGKSKKKGNKDAESKGNGDEEKPLPKLVLKVGKEHKKHKEPKSETREASNHAEGEHSSTHHKKKKKKHHKHREPEEKKEKDREKEKEKEKEKDKKSRKRERELPPNETTEHETPAKKLHLRVHKEKEKQPEPKEKEISPFRLCLENLHRNLQRKDVYNIFQFPVSDAVAPGYSKIIKTPMDFLTMSLKIERDEYTNIEQLKSDFVVMCNNAMLYNGPETIYWKSADKMLSLGLKMLSKDKIQRMNKSIGMPVSDSEDDLIQIDDSDVNVDTSLEEVPVTLKKKSEKKRKNKNKEQRNMVESILAAAHEARRKLLEKHPDQLYGYISKDDEGNHSFNILNPDTTEETKSMPLTLEKLAPKPQTGQPAGQVYKEDKKNRVVPVNYLLYGPYGSFGPTYDSSLSTTTKEDSELLLNTYGSELGIAYTKSLQNFTKDSKFSMGYVDRILDTITEGAHGKLLQKQKQSQQEEADKENKEAEKPKAKGTVNETIATRETNNVDMESLLSLDGLGIDVSFLKELVGDKDKEEKDQVPVPEEKSGAQVMLTKNADLLDSLQKVQYKRLGTKLGGTVQVGDEELKIATSLTDNLKQMMKVTTPRAVISEQGVKKAIGIGNSNPSEDKEPSKDDILDLSFEETTNEQHVPMETNG